MGAEFQVESLEDMCSLMCDNYIPEKLCDTCTYRNNVEQLKPCIIYRDNCEYYEKERDEMTREEIIESLETYIPWADEYEVDIEALKGALELLKQEPKIGHCKDCKHFEYDSVAKVDGIPLIIAHEICNRWGDGCKTREDGYCFLFEPQESEE